MDSLELWEEVLIAAVIAGILSTAEARRLYRQARRGVLGNIIPLDETIIRQATGHLQRMTPGANIEDRIQDAYLSAVRRLSGRLEQNAVTVAQWHEDAQRLISQHLVEQTLAGGGNMIPTPPQIGRIEETLRTERGFLAKFAVAVAASSAIGKPLSAAYIANRAELYGGTGRAAFYREQERQYTTRPGIVAFYEARDDERTCALCADAERQGPYLPGVNHPYPGSVCLGRHRCRCRIVFRYDLAAYRQLLGLPVAA